MLVLALVQRVESRLVTLALGLLVVVTSLVVVCLQWMVLEVALKEV